mmetsp:Transcript_23742/g.71227  ORF Transcript_23742/g.71227 Transcript_23742/m.71227 type:complete len:281 (-) Transcript_23742:24-866(-)
MLLSLSAMLMSAVNAENHHHGATYSSLVTSKPSVATGGGAGVFATAEIPPGARLVTVPVERCLTAAAALRHAVLGPRLHARFGDAAEDYANARVATRALLALVKYGPGHADDAEWKAYVDSLPWEDDCVAVPDKWAPAADVVAELAEVSREEAYRAIRLIRSRAMNLGRDAEDAERLHALVPFVDLFNHPGVAALKASHAAEDFFKTSVSDSCVRWYLSDDRRRVLVDAPAGLATAPGAELWLWYGDAGVDTSGGPFNETKHAIFVDAYGFDPWFDPAGE